MTIKEKIIGAVIDNSLWILSAAILHLLGGWIYIRSNRMSLEKDVKIGDIGDVDFIAKDGSIFVVTKISKTIAASDTEFDLAFTLRQGEKPLFDKLVAALPAGALRNLAQAAEDAALKLEASAAAPAAPAAPSA